jgi:hypothetical protein
LRRKKPDRSEIANALNGSLRPGEEVVQRYTEKKRHFGCKKTSFSLSEPNLRSREISNRFQ